MAYPEDEMPIPADIDVLHAALEWEGAGFGIGYLGHRLHHRDQCWPSIRMGVQ
jgi:hypothetical protein